MATTIQDLEIFYNHFRYYVVQLFDLRVPACWAPRDPWRRKKGLLPQNLRRLFQFFLKVGVVSGELSAGSNRGHAVGSKQPSAPSHTHTLTHVHVHSVVLRYIALHRTCTQAGKEDLERKYFKVLARAEKLQAHTSRTDMYACTHAHRYARAHERMRGGRKKWMRRTTSCRQRMRRSSRTKTKSLRSKQRWRHSNR